MDKIVKYTAFGAAAVLTAILILATVLEKSCGSGVVFEYIYRSPVFALLWVLAVAACTVTMVRCGHTLPLAVSAMHLSFVFILMGALMTFLVGEKGTLHLRADGETVRTFDSDDGSTKALPFDVSLKEFKIDFYRGTTAPMDYRSLIVIHDAGQELEREVSMNRICRHRGYRFYQASYDTDLHGTTLSVSRDTWGIALTYTGFILLIGSMILHFFNPSGSFRTALRRVSKGIAVCAGAILLASCSSDREDVPKTLPKDLAEDFGELYVYYNDRVTSVRTLAREFTMKLTGRQSYRGLTPEQVLSGWMFYYDSWKREPMIEVKGRGRLPLTDLNPEEELFQVVSMAATWSIIRIFPYVGEDGTVMWYASTDTLPFDMDSGEWLFVRKVLGLVREDVVLGDYDGASEVLAKLRMWQEEKCGADNLPTNTVWQAEQLYNTVDRPKPAAMAALTAGILLFVLTCAGMTSPALRRVCSRSVRPTAILTGVFFLYLTLLLILRWVASGHVPMSNGFETMMMIAWSSCVLSLALFRKLPVIQPFAMLMCGFALLVASIGESDPGMTSLMPVLSSPLLSVHVACMMISYSLLGLLALNGVMGIWAGRGSSPEAQEASSSLADVGRLLLYPALFLLVTGTVIGAVWANVSWGRYWAWDPKEVWALITIIVYAAALHSRSLRFLAAPKAFHRYSAAAFLCVLITYFGVNFFLGGMHSYA